MKSAASASTGIWAETSPHLGKDPTPILCVEDDSVTLARMVHILDKRFSKILTAGNGAEGLRTFQEHRPSIVITDILMPLMNGVDMARAIKCEAPATHILVVSSERDSAAILSAVDVGIAGYVIKPVSPGRLGAILDRCVQITALEKALLLSKARVESVLESIGDAFFALDRQWNFTYLNRKAEDHFKASRETLLGTSFRNPVLNPLEEHRAFTEAMETKENRVFDLFDPRVERWYEVNIFPLEGGISVYLRDVTGKRLHEEEIRNLAFYDNLTGLPNRALLQERINHALAWSVRTGQEAAVLFLDLDRFKSVNDTLGHEVGDQVLKEVAWRLKSAVRECDTVARLGGDEFVIILQGFEHPENIHSISHRILFALSQEYLSHDLPLCLTGSIGISFLPTDGGTLHELLKSADAAMYHGKGNGKNSYYVYRPDMRVENRHSLQLENALGSSIRNREFHLHYQSQHDLRTRALVGFEALARWDHSDLGSLSPEEFIPVAEETGLILQLGDWVLETACQQVRGWMDLHPSPLRIAVNLSGRQFWQSDLVESIARGLDRSGLPPSRLELELTESMVMRNVDTAIGKMRELAAKGIRLSIDDFGTGYSSLAALKRFPIHTLKIDKSFVKEVTSCPNDGAIATSIIALARAMNLTVVAEGIETLDQLEFLQERGCDIGQGYFFSEPLASAEAERMLANGPRAACSSGPVRNARSRASHPSDLRNPLKARPQTQTRSQDA